MIQSTSFFWLYSALFILTFSTISTGLNSEIVLNTGLTALDVYAQWNPNIKYQKYDSLVSQFKEILKMVESAEKTNQSPKLPQKQLDTIQQLWSEIGQSNKDQSQFNVQNAMEEAFSKKSISHTKRELKSILSKLNEDMSNQLNSMLQFELVKSIIRTGEMIRSLFNTYNLIKESNEFRNSSKIQNVTIQLKEYIDKADKYLQTAVEEINRMENTHNFLIESRTLKEISFNLRFSKIESDFAQRELNTIIDGINSTLESLSSAQNNHFYNLVLSLIKLIMTAVEFIKTPAATLTKIGKILYAAIVGLNAVNAAGHATGFYWTREEIKILKEYQAQLNPLKIEIENSFNNIKYGMEKLEQIKQFSSDSSDYNDCA